MRKQGKNELVQVVCQSIFQFYCYAAAGGQCRGHSSRVIAPFYALQTASTQILRFILIYSINKPKDEKTAEEAEEGKNLIINLLLPLTVMQQAVSKHADNVITHLRNYCHLNRKSGESPRIVYSLCIRACCSRPCDVIIVCISELGVFVQPIYAVCYEMN